MTYNVVNDFTLNEKSYKAGEEITITEEQLAELPEGTSAAFKEVVERGDVVEVPKPVVEGGADAVLPPVAADVQSPAEESVNANEGKDSASADGQASADALATANTATTTGLQEHTSTTTESPTSKGVAMSKGWVGNHTIGQESKRPNGSITLPRDPNLTRK